MNTDRYRFIIGGMLLAGLMVLAAAIALGKVEEKTSYGLTGVMTILGKATLDFTGWCFRLYQGDEVAKKDKGTIGSVSVPPEGGTPAPPTPV